LLSQSKEPPDLTEYSQSCCRRRRQLYMETGTEPIADEVVTPILVGAVRTRSAASEGFALADSWLQYSSKNFVSAKRHQVQPPSLYCSHAQCYVVLQVSKGTDPEAKDDNIVLKHIFRSNPTLMVFCSRFFMTS